ncbi:alpha-glucoside transport system substrate-binding protein [Hydrogenispora ethanolica]|jgi:alpha-glucoside transport system substrate-binding protein|uniref:Alpha-glucoside transport system substrate-binding protein n=1 Tax=Hydrogenispora ethanolica TaxID=1082276 RepID=A0A4R1R0J1_HYDET|nr:ABC transporter substrate-binding protein [Hydrogenispora ethanolica]TCL58802.1 alpha-glucoside transport system substrate-binding protein [Hydrogenispora ethanolica]
MKRKKIVSSLFVTILLGVMLLTQCAFGETAAISVTGTWGGSELATFMKICEAAGVKVNFNTTRDLNAVLATAVKAKTLPDIAILPNPGKLQELAKQGVLKPLTYVSKADLKNYARTWISLGSYAGKLYGIYFKVANKSVIWYNPKEFKKNGWAVPKTWDELVALNKKIVAAGKTPWSIGADIGWPLSDWIENIMIRTAGPEVYEKWINHEIPWTDPAVKKAFQTWGQIVGDPKNLAGGIDGTLATTFQNGAVAVFQDNPKAYLYYEGDFMSGIVTSQLPSVKVGEDMDFFAFPAINPKYGAPVVGGADVLVAFSNKPEVKKLMKYLTTVQANEIAVQGGFLSQNKGVSLDAYPNVVSRNSARILTKASIYAFDASDLMPPAVGNQGGFWDACKRYIQDPSKLDAILADMEALAKKNY